MQARISSGQRKILINSFHAGISRFMELSTLIIERLSAAYIVRTRSIILAIKKCLRK